MDNSDNMDKKSENSRINENGEHFLSQNRFDSLAISEMAEMADNSFSESQWSDVTTRKRARINTGGQNSESDQFVQSINSEEFETLSVGDKLSVLFSRMNSRMNSIEQKVDDCLNLHKRVYSLENSLSNHELRLKLLEYKSIDLEARSRRNNLIIGGISEQKDENCLTRVAEFLKDRLQIDPCPSIPRVHRLGRFKPDSTRPMIVYFLDFRDTELVLANANKLKNTNFNINRDFPKEIVNARKSLWPEYKRLRGLNPHSKISIVYPAKLVVDGHVIADVFPSWNSIMQSDRLTAGKPVFTNNVPVNIILSQSGDHSSEQSSDSRAQANSADNFTVRSEGTARQPNQHHKSRRIESPSPAPSPGRGRRHAPTTRRAPFPDQHTVFKRPWTSSTATTNQTPNSPSCINPSTDNSLNSCSIQLNNDSPQVRPLNAAC